MEGLDLAAEYSRGQVVHSSLLTELMCIEFCWGSCFSPVINGGCVKVKFELMLCDISLLGLCFVAGFGWDASLMALMALYWRGNSAAV